MIFFGANLNMASLETITPVLAQRPRVEKVQDVNTWILPRQPCRLYGWGPCLNPAECPFEACGDPKQGMPLECLSLL